MEPNNCPICNSKAIHHAPTLRTMANGDCHGSVVCAKCGFFMESDDDLGNNVLVNRWNNYQPEAHLISTRPKQVRCPSCGRFMKHWCDNTREAKILRFYCTCNSKDTVQAATFIQRRVSYHMSSVRKHWFREDEVFTGDAYRGLVRWVNNLRKED